MKQTIKKRTILIVTAIILMSGFSSADAQLLYRDRYLFLGPLPSKYGQMNFTTNPPNLFVGPKFGMEYNYNNQGGLDFFIAWQETNWGPNKLHIGDNGKVGIGRKPTTYALEVNGSVLANSGVFVTSDGALKRNIKDMSEQRLDYVTRLKRLKSKTYEKLVESGKDNADIVKAMVEAGKIPKEEAASALKDLNERKKDTYRSEYGFIAQDVKDLFPELVQEDEEGILAVNYSGLIPVLLEAIKDLQDKVDNLEQRNSDGDISIRSAGSVSNDEIDVRNEYLSQNTPNPVDGSTVIKYNLPEGTTQAAIAIYSTNGSVVKIIPLNVSENNGTITLYASDIAKGINVYRLTANGVLLGSKKLINP